MAFENDIRFYTGKPILGTDGIQKLIDNSEIVSTRSQFKGVQLYQDLQAIATATETAISFDTENYDYGGWWAIGDPTVVVVPSGVVAVTCVFALKWNDTIADMYATVLVNGSVARGSPLPRLSGRVLSGMSAPLTVTEGDEVSLAVRQASGVSKNASEIYFGVRESR